MIPPSTTTRILCCTPLLSLALVILTLLGAASALGEGPPAAGKTREDRAQAALEYFTDVVLVNQHGDPMRLYSDLLRDKIVVICPFFTSCQGVCPVLSQKLAAFQQHLGERVGQDIYLLSISVDPETDTPEKLEAYAKSFKAGPGWYFLGGKKENVDFALYKLGQYTENKEGHKNILILGNEAAGHWSKVFGLSPTQELVQALDRFLAGEG